MKMLTLPGFVLLSVLALMGCQPAENGAEAQPFTVAKNSVNTDVAALATAVADWQLAHLDDFSYVRTFQDHTEFERGWIQAAFYIGLTRWAEVSDNQIYWQALLRKGEATQWRLGDLEWHADDQAIAQVYAALAERNKDMSLLAPARAGFQAILGERATNTLEFMQGGEAEGTCQRRWCWCDALFMAPPAWAAMSRLTGDPTFVQYAHEEYQATIDYLYDREEHLFYRDSRFFERRSKNDRKVFWSRGNGWVFAGLPLFLEQLSVDDPRRADYETLFIAMAEKLITLQQHNGFWPSSLLDADEFPIPESSGTGFMTFGLAWGINQGLLPAEKFSASAKAGWAALASAVDKDGRLGWVQQVGYSPEQVNENDTQLYGVGALLLAAAEMSRLQ